MTGCTATATHNEEPHGVASLPVYKTVKWYTTKNTDRTKKNTLPERTTTDTIYDWKISSAGEAMPTGV